MATTDLERQSTPSKVDAADVPSRDWGWSSFSPGAVRIFSVLGALALLAMTHGNHTGKTEDLFLVVFAVLTLAIVIVPLFTRRRKWKN